MFLKNISKNKMLKIYPTKLLQFNKRTYTKKKLTKHLTQDENWIIIDIFHHQQLLDCIYSMINHSHCGAY